MRFSNAQNMAESDFWEKFFPAENTENMPEIAVFADFYQTFSLYFVAFSHKTLVGLSKSAKITTTDKNVIV